MMAAASGLREMANHTRVNVMAAFRANGHARTAPQGSIVKPGASIKTQLEKAAHSGLTRALSLPDSTAIVVGIVIGAGIFLIPKLVAQATPSIPAILCMWVLGGVVCFLGALGYAELGAMMPLSGGHYVYLRECYGPLCGFLCGWTFVLVVAGAAIAWLAVSFSITLGYFVRLGPVASKILSLALIAVLAWVNYRGVKPGARVQNFFTALKLLGLAVIAGSAFLPGRGHASTDSGSTTTISWSAVGAAMIAVLMCYDGWTNISYVAGEVARPKRNIPLALGLGLAIITTVYVLANLAYFRVLTLSEIAGAERVGALAADRTLGSAGGVIVSVTVLLSIMGSINGFILTAPRICFAMAQDGLMFEKLAFVHPRFKTMPFGILAQVLWAAVLVLTGSFETLVSYAMIAAWFFYGLTVAGVVVMRRRHPARERPYRMWGYPVTPLLFVLVAMWFVISTWISQPGPSTAAFLIIATGVPVYYAWRRKRARDIVAA